MDRRPGRVHRVRSLLQPFFFLYGAAMAALGAMAMGYRLPVPGLGRASRAATRR
jgi:hypothetical protein